VSKNILVIDDSETNLVLLEAVLGEDGYKTILARSVGEGLKLMKAKNPSLILLDILMPKRSGLDFLTEMRKDASFDQIPVFVVTAANDEIKPKVMAFGIADYFTKPIDIISISERVKEVLQD
jgi:Response regulator containing CheY-like receiver, AAA-type ATPase, and DNA-binding domains